MMFGADTPLVMDALQMVAVAAVAVGGGVYLLMRRRASSPASDASQRPAKGDLEDRVRVLERIATDQSIGLSDEIEALRDTPASPRETENAAQ